MGIGLKSGFGGNPLNFRVVGNPQPASPRENTIWLDTDVKITGYSFSAAQPEEPEEGMVYITTHSASAVEFNALKKNSIQVYPVCAHQYVGGVWVMKEAYLYNGTEWEHLRLYFVKDGEVLNGAVANISYNYDAAYQRLKIMGTGASGEGGRIDYPLTDFGPYKTLVLDIEAGPCAGTSSDSGFGYGYSDAQVHGWRLNLIAGEKVRSAFARTTKKYDISTVDTSHYVNTYLINNYSSDYAYIYNVYLE